MAEYLIPHPNIPTTDIGIPKLKENTTLNNENFLALDSALRSLQSMAKGLDSSKAAADHDHDDRYAAISHEHSMQEVSGLVEQLSNYAPLSHVHDQYLTSIPYHSHMQSEIDGLIESLAAKANFSHTHNIGDINILEAELADKATQSQLQDVANTIPSLSGLTDKKFVAAFRSKEGGSVSLQTPKNQPPTIEDDQYEKGAFVSLDKTDAGNICFVKPEKQPVVNNGASGGHLLVLNNDGELTNLQELEEGASVATRGGDIDTGELLVGGGEGTYLIAGSGVLFSNVFNDNKKIKMDALAPLTANSIPVTDANGNLTTNGSIKVGKFSSNLAGGKWVKTNGTDGTITESNDKLGYFEGNPSGGKWVKTNGTDGKLVGVDFTGIEAGSTFADENIAVCEVTNGVNKIGSAKSALAGKTKKILVVDSESGPDDYGTYEVKLHHETWTYGNHGVCTRVTIGGNRVLYLDSQAN